MATWSAHLALLFREHPFLERFGRAKEYGFDCVEWWWPEGPVAELVQEVRRLELEVASINAPAGDVAAGERGLLSNPARHEEALRGVRQALGLAADVGSPCINLQVGRDDGRRPRAVQLDAVASALAEAARLADDAGVLVLLEGLNERDVSGYLLPDPRAVTRMIERVGSDSLRLLYDAYHVGMAGRDPARDVAAYRDVIGHVQLADWPGRVQPGAGVGNVRGFVEALPSIGYDGPVGLEFEPTDGTLAALSELRLPGWGF